MAGRRVRLGAVSLIGASHAVGRRTARAAVLSVVMLLCVGAGRMVWRFGTWDGRRPDIADPRACPGSTVQLAEATGHFGLVLPASATEIKFASDLHPLFGEYFILLSFRTDPAGLRSFLARSRLPQPHPARQHETVLLGTAYEDCGITAGDSVHLVSTGDDEAGYTRALVIDLADPGHPRVLVQGLD